MRLALEVEYRPATGRTLFARSMTLRLTLPRVTCYTLILRPVMTALKGALHWDTYKIYSMRYDDLHFSRLKKEKPASGHD
jgi:hypothetical protein